MDALYSVFTDIHSTFYSIRVSIYHIRAKSSPQECYLMVLKDFFVDMIKHQLNLFIPIRGGGEGVERNGIMYIFRTKGLYLLSVYFVKIISNPVFQERVARTALYCDV